MKFEITQEGAGTYEIEAVSEEHALREMAEGIVDNTDDWQTQFATEDREEAIEKAAATLSIS